MTNAEKNITQSTEQRINESHKNVLANLREGIEYLAQNFNADLKSGKTLSAEALPADTTLTETLPAKTFSDNWGAKETPITIGVKLTQIATKVISLERKIYGLDKPDNKSDGKSGSKSGDKGDLDDKEAGTYDLKEMEQMLKGDIEMVKRYKEKQKRRDKDGVYTIHAL